MDFLWNIVGVIVLLIGIAGCVLPVIPGQILSWGSLIILQLKSQPPFTTDFILFWAVVTGVVTLLDYYVPVWGTKKLGGSRYGIWGAALGLVVGIFFLPPFGLIAGPFLGAMAGEIIAGKNSNVAFRSGLGSFVGFVAGTFMKLVISLIMGYYFVINAFF